MGLRRYPRLRLEKGHFRAPIKPHAARDLQDGLVYEPPDSSRHATFFPNLKGRVEVDETYVGGKIRDNKGKHGTGRGTTNKTPVMVLVSREGPAISRVLPSIKADTLQGIIEETVVPSATILTDELKAYWGIGGSFKGGHHTVKHNSRKWVRKGWIHTNTAESYFALFKRGIHGSFHHVSKKHLQRYCDEFAFRWTNRKITDEEREGVL